MDVFDLVAKLTLDSSEYDSGLDESESKASSFGDKFKSALGTAGKVGAGALAAVTAAGTAVAGALVSGTKDLAAYGDQIDKNSQKLGMSAEAYQEWDAILQHSGSSIDALSGPFRTMQKAIESNSEAFQQLGISEEQVATMSKEDLFSAVITGLQGMEEGAERSAIATDLLGRGAMELGPLLNTSAEDTEAMRQAVHDLGGVMSDEAVKSSAAFQDTLQDTQTAIQGLGRNIMSEFLPSITTVINGVGMLFTGDEGASAMIGQGLSEMIDKIKGAMPNLIDTGMQLMDSLLDVIIDNLPEIIQMGTEILVKLILGIIQALPKLIAKAPEIISALVGALKQAAPQLLSASLELILTLGRGLVNNLPRVREWGRQIIESVKNAIMGKVHEAADWGRDLIQNFIDGVVGKFAALRDTISNVAGTVASYLHFSEPDEGPLKNFHTYAPDMIDLFVKGLKDGESKLQKQLGQTFSLDDPSVNAGGSYSAAPITLNIYGAAGQDVNQLANIVMDRINLELTKQRRAVGWT